METYNLEDLSFILRVMASYLDGCTERNPGVFPGDSEHRLVPRCYGQSGEPERERGGGDH